LPGFSRAAFGLKNTARKPAGGGGVHIAMVEGKHPRELRVEVSNTTANGAG